MTALATKCEQAFRRGGLLALFLASSSFVLADAAPLPQDKPNVPSPELRPGDRAEQLTQKATPGLDALLKDLRFGLSDDRPTSAWAHSDSVWSCAPIEAPSVMCGELMTRVEAFDADSQANLTDAFQSLRRALGSYVPGEYGKYKVVEVVPLPDNTFRTRVLFEFVRSGKMEAHLDMELTWDGLAPCRVTRGSVLQMQRTLAARPLFVERTRGLLANAPQAAQLLANGGREWATRLDDAGATAWFGHHGMAFGDVNGDGRPDAYLGMPNGLPNQLLLQAPDGSLQEAEPGAQGRAAWLDDTKGVLLVDLDRDGDRDLVAALQHVLVLHQNDGAGNFQVAGWCVAPTEAPFYSVAAADIDGDGDLDLYGTRYVRNRYGDSIPIPLEDARNGPTNHLFRNEGLNAKGQFVFVDATTACGLDVENNRFSLAASFADFDRDGDPDLYVANDFGRNQLFQNQGGRFTDVAAAWGAEDQGAGMGVSWGDINHDGRQDLFVSNMYSSAGRRIAFQEGFGQGAGLAGLRDHARGNSLLMQTDSQTFENRADAAGVRMGRWSWGGLMVDLNGDGLLDLYSPNGFITGPKTDDL